MEPGASLLTSHNPFCSSAPNLWGIWQKLMSVGMFFAASTLGLPLIFSGFWRYFGMWGIHVEQRPASPRGLERYQKTLESSWPYHHSPNICPEQEKPRNVQFFPSPLDCDHRKVLRKVMQSKDEVLPVAVGIWGRTRLISWAVHKMKKYQLVISLFPKPSSSCTPEALLHLVF